MIDETWQMPHSYNLLGPHLLNDLLNLGLTQDCDEALKEFDLNLATIAAQEPQPGLGNGGSGVSMKQADCRSRIYGQVAPLTPGRQGCCAVQQHNVGNLLDRNLRRSRRKVPKAEAEEATG
jgi:hypothetical protein